MSRFVLAASLVSAIAVAACGANAAEPSPPPSASPVGPSAAPSLAPPPSDAPEPSVSPEPTSEPPDATPRPRVTPPPATPEPDMAEVPEDFTPAEQYLLDGVLRGAIDCEPAGGSDDLPREAIAGIECASDDSDVFRIGFYLFGNDDDMLDAYFFRMNAEGVAKDSGSCRDGEHESAYTPGEELVPARHGCFINDDGAANYRATLPGVHVYIGIYGTGDDMIALEDFAWLGNPDTPGNPTLWGSPS